MNKNFKFGWVIKILSKDENGFQTELADLGTGKHMIVVTDLTFPLGKDVYKQAGYGPFVYNEGDDLKEYIDVLKQNLLEKR